MSAPLRVLLVTESFPPVCGGSGWSTYELAHGLLARGHHVEVVKIEVTPRTDAVDAPPAQEETRYESFRVSIFRKTAPTIPVLRNVVKNERLWSELTTYLRARLTREPVDIIHAQHVLTTCALSARSWFGTDASASISKPNWTRTGEPAASSRRMELDVIEVSLSPVEKWISTML